MEKNNDNNENLVSENENKNNDNITYINEKKIIICLIIISLLLIYYSLFFIHDINYRGTIQDKKQVEIEYSQKKDRNNISIDSNSSNNNNLIKNNNTILNNIIYNNSVNNNISSGTNNGAENGETNNPTQNIVNNKDRFKIMQGTKEWKDLKSLDIFRNEYFNNNSIIAPGVHGKYSFTVENYKENKVKYNLEFIEENVYNINMVYKLKLNGVYIAGNENEFVKYEELNKKDLVVEANSNDLFTIEWKWQDDKNDTQIGKTEDANYKLKIKVDAYEI